MTERRYSECGFCGRQSCRDCYPEAVLPHLAPKPTGSDDQTARTIAFQDGRYAIMDAAKAALAAVRTEERAAQAAQIAALREALEPFAAPGKRLPDVWRDHETHWTNWEQSLTAGHLRAARAALEITGGPTTPNKEPT